MYVKVMNNFGICMSRNGGGGLISLKVLNVIWVILNFNIWINFKLI